MSGKKYLDSEKVIMLLRKDLICKYPSSFYFGLWAAADEIAKMDGEDVRPVKRGEWIDETYEVASHTGGVAVVHTGRVCCSECDEYEDYRRPFCPNCGADMRPKEDNDG